MNGKERRTAHRYVIDDLFVDFNRVGVTVMIATHDEQVIARASAKTTTRSLRLTQGVLTA